MKELKSKYPEKLEMRYRYQAASQELILAWKTYNAIRKKLNSKKATEEDFINLGKSLEDWDKAQNKIDSIQSEINQFTNLKFYGNRNEKSN